MTPAAGIDAASLRSGAPRTARAAPRPWRVRPRARPGARPPGSSSAREDQRLQLVLEVVVQLEAAGSSTLRPLSSAGLCDAETMIPAPNSPLRRGTRGPASGPRRRRGRGPMLVAPAVIAAANMSPDRRVSWPSTIDRAAGRRTGGPSHARGRTRATVRRSRLAAPRIPSVPNRRVMQGPRGGREGRGQGTGSAWAPGWAPAAARRRGGGGPSGWARGHRHGHGLGRDRGDRHRRRQVRDHGHLVVPGPSSSTLTAITIGELSRRSRSAVEPNSVSRMTRSEPRTGSRAARPSSRRPAVTCGSR